MITNKKQQMSEIKLPTVLTEDVWFYKKHKDRLEEHLGKPYISYSSSSSWYNYREDFIKQKFVGLPQSESIYAELGNYLGGAVETGEFGKNKHSFTGQENFKLIPRPKKGQFERFVLIDFEDFIFIGFIDIYEEKKKKANIGDLKTGGSGKEEDYKKEDYTQVVLYAHAVEREGIEIGDTYVWFVRRTGSHVYPPIHISEEQFKIPIEYNKERVKFALAKLRKSVEEISDHYKTYLKFFGDE